MKFIISFFFVLLFTISLFGQSAAIQERELQVEKDYNTQIYAVEPIFDFSKITLPSRSTTPFLVDSLIGIAPYTPAVGVDIEPISYSGIANLKGHNAFAKVDKGTANIWHGQGGYTYSAPNYYSITASGEYDQWQDPDVLDQNSRILRSAIAGTYYLTSSIKSTLRIAYQQQRMGRYGGLLPESEQLLQEAGYNNANAQIGIESFHRRPSAWNYKFQTSANKWNSIDENAAEYNWNIEGMASYDVSNKLTLSIEPNSFISSSAFMGNATIYSTALTGRLRMTKASVRLGGQVAYGNDELLVWPTADINWQIANNSRLTVSADQEVLPVNAYWISTTNPYIATTSLLSDVPYRLDYKAIHHSQRVGFSFESLVFLDYNLSFSGSYSRMNNDLNFFHLEESQASFDFEMVDYQVINSGISVSRRFLENELEISAGVEYNHFFNQSETLWHRPVAQGKLHVFYHPFEKLNVGLSGLFNTPQNLSKVPEEIIQSEWRANASFEVKYQLLDKLSIHANADNIFNNRYQVWNAHPTFGRNLSAGLLLKL